MSTEPERPPLLPLPEEPLLPTPDPGPPPAVTVVEPDPAVTDPELPEL